MPFSFLVFKGLRAALPLALATSCATVKLPPAAIQKNPHELSMSWKELVSLTLEKNPDLLAARSFTQSNKYDRNIAAGDYLPKAEGFVDRSRTGRASLPKENNLSVGVAVTQNLFSGFETTGNTLQAQKEFQSAVWAYSETSSNVRFRLRSAYIELLKLQKRRSVDERVAERRKQNAELIRLRYEAGREHVGSALKAEALVGQAFFETRQTGRRMKTQSLNLGKEIGGDFNDSLEIKEDLEKIIPDVSDTQPDFEDLANRTPTIQKLVKDAEAAKAAIITAQSTVYPKVDGTYEYANSGDRAENLKKDSFLGLRVSVPFFEGGQNVQGILKARADFKTAQEAAKSARDARITELSAAWAAYVDAVELVTVQRKFVEAGRKRSEIIRAQYSSNLSSFQEFDQAEQDLANSEKNYVQSLADALLGEANWQFTRGLTLEEDETYDS